MLTFLYSTFWVICGFHQLTNSGQTEPLLIHILVWHAHFGVDPGFRECATGQGGMGKVLRDWQALITSRQWVHHRHVRNSTSRCGERTVKGESTSSWDCHSLEQGARTVTVVKHTFNHLYACLFCLSFGLAPSLSPHPHTETPCPLSVVSNDLANQDTYWSFRSASLLFQRSQT